MPESCRDRGWRNRKIGYGARSGAPANFITTCSASFSLSLRTVTDTASPWPRSDHSFLSNSFSLCEMTAFAAWDAHRRAVVLFEFDHLEVWIIARQAAQILDIRAAPAVDRLVVVTHRRKTPRGPAICLSSRYWQALVSWYSSTSR